MSCISSDAILVIWLNKIRSRFTNLSEFVNKINVMAKLYPTAIGSIEPYSNGNEITTNPCIKIIQKMVNVIIIYFKQIFVL